MITTLTEDVEAYLTARVWSTKDSLERLHIEDKPENYEAANKYTLALSAIAQLMK